MCRYISPFLKGESNGCIKAGWRAGGWAGGRWDVRPELMEEKEQQKAILVIQNRCLGQTR